MALANNASGPRTASPWWVSAGFAFALALVFLGERPFGTYETIRLITTGLGCLLVMILTAIRVVTWRAASGQKRIVEKLLLLCHIGAIASLLLYALTTETGRSIIGLGELENISRLTTPMTIMWTIVMAMSVIPLFAMELSLGTSDRWGLLLKTEATGSGENAAIDTFRTVSMAASGLTIALAAALLMVTCSVAEDRNIRHDFSYFKTSSPGTATTNIVSSISGEGLKVLLFFPEVSDVKSEVLGYFNALKQKTDRIIIETHDRVASPMLAKKYRASKDGTVVFVHRDRNEVVTIGNDMKRGARSALRTFDSKVQKAVMKVIRAKRIAYLSTGHGEINDAEVRSVVIEKAPRFKSREIKNVLKRLNYVVKEWGTTTAVPEDATMVLVLGPRTPFLDAELEALDDYLAGGGSVLIALDPRSKIGLGKLETRLGVGFDAAQLADDRMFLRARRNATDHQYILTNQFSAHAAMTTLSKYRTKTHLPFIGAGSLRDVPFGDAADKPKRSYVIRSMDSTFSDINGNFIFDKESEKRTRYKLAAAIEHTPKPRKKDPVEKKPTAKPAEKVMRAMVIADVDLFTDSLIGRLLVAKFFFEDIIKWLGGEEHFAGTTVSEKDVRIKHTGKEDVVWFYSSILGAPLLVFLFGIVVASRRRLIGRTK